VTFHVLTSSPKKALGDLFEHGVVTEKNVGANDSRGPVSDLELNHPRDEFLLQLIVSKFAAR
jgi:hypothetical protein